MNVQSKKYRLPFKSKLHEWICGLKQESATVQHWTGMFNNLQGIRKEEIDRSCIHLALQDLSPDEVLDRVSLADFIELELAACQPDLITYCKTAFLPTLDVRAVINQKPLHVEPRARCFVESAQTCYQHPSMGYWIIRTGYEDLATSAPNWIVLDHNGKMLRSHARHGGWFPSALEAFDEMHRAIRKRFGNFGSERPITLYDQYAFLGGRNYQEWFIRLPNWPLLYRDSHFHLSKLLVHIRTTERIDDDGLPLLMIEEIQSPWHADIRKYGSTTQKDEIGEEGMVADAPFGKEWHELAIKATLWLALKQGHTRIGFTTGKQQCARWWNMQGLMNLYDSDIPKCLEKISNLYDCNNDWATIVTRKPVGNLKRENNFAWVVKDEENKSLTAPLANKDVALFYLNERSTPVKEQVRLLQISPILKQAMNAGQIPLFGW